MMRQEYYQDRIYGLDEYETKKAEKTVQKGQKW